MNLDPGLKPQSILAVAVKSEIEAASLYSHLQARVRNEVLRQKLKFLAGEEERHRTVLERLFSQRFAGQELKIPDESLLPLKRATIDESTSVLDIFKIALEKEKEAEEFYRESRKRMEDRGSQKLLDYLSRVERSHYFMIKSEIDLLEKFPDYYNVEDFHLGQDLFHIGP